MSDAFIWAVLCRCQVVEGCSALSRRVLTLSACVFVLCGYNLLGVPREFVLLVISWDLVIAYSPRLKTSLDRYGMELPNPEE